MRMALPALAVALLVAAGCGDSRTEKGADILKGHRNQMERAKGVEQTLDKAAQERREQVDQQSK